MALETSRDEMEQELLADLMANGIDRDTAINAICATYTGQEHSVALRAALEFNAAKKSRLHLQPAPPAPTAAAKQPAKRVAAKPKPAPKPDNSDERLKAAAENLDADLSAIESPANSEKAGELRSWLDQRDAYREKRKKLKKEKTMTPTTGATGERMCGKPGCGKKIGPTNRSGFCQSHFYLSTLTGARRGRPKATTGSRRSEPTPPRKTAAKATGVVTICVTEANLNNFWNALSLEEKAELYQRQLEGV